MWRPSTRPTREWALAALLVAVTVAVYAPVVRHGFVNYDDNLYVTENPHVQQGLTAESVRWAFTACHANNWHPLTWCAHMLDVELFGLWAGGHHLSSLVLHLLNTLLLFGLLRALTGSAGRSALVAALFALHPAHVESVAWVAERKDVLSTAFYFLTLAAYAGWARTGRAGLYRLSLGLFALGLMAKPMLVSVPVVLLLLDGWPLARLPAWTGGLPPPAVRRELGRRLLEKAPFAALALASGVVTLLAQRSAMVPLRMLTLPERLTNSALAYVRYIGELVWPADLAVFYPLPRAFDTGPALAAGAVLLAATAAAVWWARRLPWLPVGWGWYLVTLLPVIGLVQVGAQSMADRYTYVPYVGLFVLLAWGGGRLLEGRPAWARRAGAAAAVVAVAALALVAARQVGHWRDSIALFTRAVSVTELNDKAHDNLSVALLAAGRIDEAEAHCRTAIAINPGSAVAQSNLGTILFTRGRTADAAAQYRVAVRLQPGDPDYLYKLGSSLHKLGRLDEAAGWYYRALQRAPEHPLVHFYLGEIMAARQQPEAALMHYRVAVAGQPEFARAWLSLGRTLAGGNRLDEAAAAWAEAARLDPDLAEARYSLGTWLATHGRLREALPHLEAAVRLRPGDARARNNLGSALLNAGRPVEAAVQLEEALRLRPDYPQAADNLRRVRAQLLPEAN